MVKCMQSQCAETAHYGIFFGKPLTCKTHIGPGHGSVRRKCTNDGCAMAAWATKTTMCDRCAKVYDDIETYRRTKLRELAEQFGHDASAIATAPPAEPKTAVKPVAKSAPAARTVSMAVPASGETKVSPVIQQRAKTPGRAKAATLIMGAPEPPKARTDAIGGH